MQSMYFIVLIAASILCIISAIADWDWFMNHHKARFFVNIFDRNSARIFYVILGIGLLILSIIMGYNEGFFGA